ncbi:GvpL/GvpF family gas vesicle protein [Streptomyces sp. Tu 2975]|uniref:GvpL/GvpF family gas vesicle protein n=1 Tax=Streptomyces sp. Tu 2975 TaxID=2676871 RepID=UPI001ABE24C0|nr:GvpL/GvpF family gas vesicle protein [Streptomyces sp. Tu 2975]
MNELLYVYAVARPFEGGVPLAATGVGGLPARPVEHDGLVAVVSEVRAEDFEEAPLRERLEDLEWLAGTARAHESVVRAVSAVTGVVPLRLATVCRGESGVRRLLDEGHHRFTTNLDRLEGRVEWGVKLYAEPDHESDPAPTAAPEAVPGQGQQTQGGNGAASPGRDYLRRRLRSRQSREKSWAHADALARQLHTELSRCADGQRLHRPQSGQLARASGVNVLNAAFLVRREESDAFVGQVERLTPRNAAVRVELTGPWAPYSFADLSDPPDAPSGRQEKQEAHEGRAGT